MPTRIPLAALAALAGCGLSPQEAAMQHPDPHLVTGTASPATGHVADDAEPAARHIALAPAPTGSNANPSDRPDSPAEARGRRILSTAFVMMGPDGHLTVEMGEGRTLVLRDVAMRVRDYCGIQVSGGRAGKRHCGGYAEVTAARAGGGPVLSEPTMSDRLASPSE